MKSTNELMIGDYVMDSISNGFPMYVQAIYGEDTVYLDFEGNEGDTWEMDIKDVGAIEITEDLLEKLGFGVVEGIVGWEIEKEVGDNWIVISTLANHKDRKWWVYIDNQDRDGICSCDVQYLHQLQQIVRIATGEELEVKL